MRKQDLKTIAFIERARLIHGDKYDYSKVEYINSRSKVCIICPEHGEFWQKPSSHLQGKGCSKCCGTKKLTTEEFIERAKKIHGDKYDYSKVVYINNHTKVCIICPIHGEFWQTPKNHLKSVGCYKCSKVFPLTKEIFEKRGKIIHGDKYDYSKVEYINYETKVCIICKEHGEFWQTPHDHLSGYGCPFCAKVAKITVDMFKERGCKIHNGKYDYSKVTEIKNSYSKVTIICPEHGEFEQMVYCHLQGKGCPICNESHLEKDVRNALIDNNIEFIPQYRNKEIFGLQSLDFYLPKLKIGIECQGEQHFQNSRRYQKLEQIQERDERKNKICKENDIELIYYFNKKYNDLYKFNNQYFNTLNEIISYIAKK